MFHRVVAPEYENMIPVTDKDLKTALHFMISIATILEEMTRDLIEYNGRNFGFQIYQDKINRYKPTYNGMMEDFYDNIFGEYTNRITQEEFRERLTA